MTNPLSRPTVLFAAQIEVKRGEEHFLVALGKMIDPKNFNPQLVGALHTALLAARDAGTVLSLVIRDAERAEHGRNVIPFSLRGA